MKEFLQKVSSNNTYKIMFCVVVALPIWALVMFFGGEKEVKTTTTVYEEQSNIQEDTQKDTKDDDEQVVDNEKKEDKTDIVEDETKENQDEEQSEETKLEEPEVKSQVKETSISISSITTKDEEKYLSTSFIINIGKVKNPNTEDAKIIHKIITKEMCKRISNKENVSFTQEEPQKIENTNACYITGIIDGHYYLASFSAEGINSNGSNMLPVTFVYRKDNKEFPQKDFQTILDNITIYE